MDRVLEVDAANRLVVTQPGVFNADLSRAVAEHGLFYPPDPSSWEFCSIGGNLVDELRRPVLREVRRHHGLRARPRGRARLRRGGAHRPAHRQGRRRLRPDPALRGQRGHARRHHGGDAVAASGVPGAGRRWRRCSARRRTPPPRSPRSWPRVTCRACWRSWTGRRCGPRTPTCAAISRTTARRMLMAQSDAGGDAGRAEVAAIARAGDRRPGRPGDRGRRPGRGRGAAGRAPLRAARAGGRWGRR